MKSATTQIGKYEYVVTAVPAKVGVRIASKLANALAPAAKALPEEGFEMDVQAIVRFIEPIISNEDLADLLDYLNATFAERTLIRWIDDNGTERTQPLARVFDEHFSDSYDDWIMWLGFALQTSMASFFRGVQGLGELAALGNKSNSKSPSSAAKTGPAGE